MGWLRCLLCFLMIPQVFGFVWAVDSVFGGLFGLRVSFHQSSKGYSLFPRIWEQSRLLTNLCSREFMDFSQLLKFCLFIDKAFSPYTWCGSLDIRGFDSPRLKAQVCLLKFSFLQGFSLAWMHYQSVAVQLHKLNLFLWQGPPWNVLNHSAGFVAPIPFHLLDLVLFCSPFQSLLFAPKLWCILPRHVRTLTFGRLMGFPLNHEKLNF